MKNMKNHLTAIFLAIAASSALAQTAPTTLDTSKLTRVASPNRTLSSTLAATSKAKVGGDHVSTTALVLVDATGKTLGRFSGSYSLILPYNNQFLNVYLGSDYDYVNKKYNSTGFAFSPNSVFYTTSDCTGTAYQSFQTPGTQYVTFTVLDAGQYFLYIGDSANSVNTTVLSVFGSAPGACFSTNFTQPLIPLTTVIPASQIGTPPFFLK
jgi:hypothetical protein